MLASQEVRRACRCRCQPKGWRWKVDHRRSSEQEADDPLARTYNFLQKLSVPGLALEDEPPLRHDGLDPYDNARAFKNKKPVSRK